ncbi:MAG: hypothetical protein ABJC74_14080 [Gemmatimonadota bacterium]
MSSGPRYLHLELRPSPPRVLERVIARHPDIRVVGDRIIVPLARYRAEEVMAECRRLGLRVVASYVKRDGHAG